MISALVCLAAQNKGGHGRRRVALQRGLRGLDGNRGPPRGDGSGALDTALDSVRDRYGSRSVVRAVLLGRDDGWTVPMLPD